jgi:hypothetical protein
MKPEWDGLCCGVGAEPRGIGWRGDAMGTLKNFIILAFIAIGAGAFGLLQA